VISFTRCLLYPRGNDPGYLSDSRLRGPQSRTERRADEKSLPFSETEHRFPGRPASSQVVTLTELSRFMNRTKQVKIINLTCPLKLGTTLSGAIAKNSRKNSPVIFVVSVRMYRKIHLHKIRCCEVLILNFTGSLILVEIESQQALYMTISCASVYTSSLTP
jgi:hypothetical protein